MEDFEEKLNKILSSPKDMEKIMNLAKSFTGGTADAPSDTESSSSRSGSPGADFDPKMISMLTKLLGEYSSSSNDKAALMNTMRPFLKEDRREKLDRALKIAKLAKVAKTAFTEFSGGDFHL